MSPRTRSVSPPRQARSKESVLDYPGFALRTGVVARSTIRAVQGRLNQVGCGPIPVSGAFDRATQQAVRLLQARSVDGQGQSLKIDGVVGPLTWAALFGAHRIPSLAATPISPFMKATLSVALSQVGVMEDPPGSNRGPQVDEYLKSAGLDPSAGMLEYLRERDPRVEAVQGSATQLPFEDGSFDLTFCVAVMHHIANPEDVHSALIEMVRVTRLGGLILVWDHNPRNPYWKHLMARVPQDDGSERLIPEAEITGGLTDGGARIESSRRLGMVPDFVPPSMLGAARVFEKAVEKVPGARTFCAHNVVIARRR